jgi:hypothetical protein
LDGKYSVSVSWVDSLSFFSSKLKQNLSSGKNVFPVPEKMVFSSVYEVDQFLCSFCRNLNPTKEDSIYLFWNHFWIPLFLSRQTYADMRDAIATTNLFCITPGNSVVDKWCAAFWDKAGMKEKTGVKLFLGTDLVIYKDLVIQIFYPQEIKDAIDEVYSSTKNVKDLDLDGFFKKVFEKKTRIPVLISKNKEVAEELSGMIRKLFEK